MPAFEFNTLQGNRRQRRGALLGITASTPSRSSLDVAPLTQSTVHSARRIPAAHRMLLDLFGRPPVVVHRSFVEVAGGVAAALWLSYAVSLSGDMKCAPVAKLVLSDEECSEATGMSLAEQAQARNDLRIAGLIRECGNDAGQTYVLDLERLSALLIERGESGWSAPDMPAGKSTSKVMPATAA